MSIVFMNQERGLQQKLAAPVANEELKKNSSIGGSEQWHPGRKKLANRQLIGVSTSRRNHKCRTYSDKKMVCCLTEESVLC